MSKKKYTITKEDQLKWYRAVRRQAEIDAGLLGLRSPKIHNTSKKDRKRQNNIRRDDYE